MHYLCNGDFFFFNEKKKARQNSDSQEASNLATEVKFNTCGMRANETTFNNPITWSLQETESISQDAIAHPSNECQGN